MQPENDTVKTWLWAPAVALVLLTRLPMPTLPKAAFADQARSAWAFPLAGLAIALPAAAIGWALVQAGLNAWAAAGLVVALQVVLTGAMHEDGLADTADGLWGGFTPERRLEIMKDSRIGTYGVLALVLSVGLRWDGTAALLDTGQIGALVAVAMFSRGVLPGIMYALPPARSFGLSHGVGQTPFAIALAACAMGLGALFLAIGWAAVAVGLIACTVVCGLGLIARAKIGGQTGDILGASQQIAEISALLVLSTMV